MLSKELKDELMDIFGSNIIELKKDKNNIAYRLNEKSYTIREVSSFMSCLKNNYNFLYSITVEDDEIVCLIVNESNDPRFYLYDIIESLEIYEYFDNIERLEKISDGIKNRYSYDSAFYIAILAVHMSVENENILDKVHEKLDIQEDKSKFKSKIDDMKKEIEFDILE